MDCCRHNHEHAIHGKPAAGGKTVYTCPMHPEIRQERPGMCPECGMDLVPMEVKSGNHQGHDPEGKQASRGAGKHAGHSTAMFLRKFWVSLVLTLPVVLYADVLKTVFDWKLPDFPGLRYMPLVLGSIVFFYGGWVFLSGAYRELRARLPGMMTLIGIAISAAYIWSVYAVFAGEEALFWELTTLITIMLLGHWLEMRAVSGAQGALKELSRLLPDMAEVVRGDKTERVSLSKLVVGDTVLVRPGGKVPADGEIVDGESELDESMITGESRPVHKGKGAAVIAGTINGDEPLKIGVTEIGEKTFLSGVMRLVAEAQASKSRLQILSDKAAFYLTLVAVLGGIATLAAWLAAGAETAFAVSRLVAVLVIACPHALGLAVPLIASISTTKAAHNGFLVKQRLALEAARTIDTVLFDKTGTLTEGRPKVTASTSDEALSLAAAVDAHSEHPTAIAIVNEAEARGLAVKHAQGYKRLPGIGGEAMVDGKKIFVGHRGGDEMVVERGGETIGRILVADAVRTEAKQAVAGLQDMGLRIVMITGDAEDVAKEISRELGINEYFARVMPHEKSKKVRELQARGRKVAMVGDGINDAPALAQADLGVAIGAGTNVAIESAGIILVKNDPRDIVKIVRLSRLTYTKMIQNLFWATGYNLIAMPLAAGALYFKGIILEPAVAAVLMSASTVIVAANAMILKRKTL